MHILRSPRLAAVTALVALGLVVAPAMANATTASAATAPVAAVSATASPLTRSPSTGTPGATGTPGPASTPSTATTPGPAATPGTATDASTTTTVSVTPGNQGVLRPGEDLTLGVTVTNRTGAAFPATTASVTLIRGVVGSRDDLDDWLGDTSTDGYVGEVIARVPVPAVAAGRTVRVDGVRVRSATVALGGYASFGARRLAVTYDAGSAREVGRSALTWYPSLSQTPTGVSVAVPITVPATTTGLLSASVLAADTSVYGTLTQQLDAAIDHNVALGVDPRIIASIRILGENAPDSATAWLERLTQARNETFPLTYADSDVTGLRQAGASGVLTPISLDQAIVPGNFPGASAATPSPSTAGTPGSTATTAPTGGASGSPTSGTAATPTTTATAGAGDSTGASGTGASGTGATDTSTDGATAPGDATPTLPTTQTLLAFPWTLSGVAWPTEDTVATDDLPALTAAGYSRTILASGNTTTGPSSAVGASEKVGADGVLVSDEGMSRLLRDAATATGTDAWQTAMTRLTATLATTTRVGGTSSPLLLTLGRDWPTDDTRLGQTLTALEHMDWVSPTDLSTTTAAPSGAVTLVSRPQPDVRVDQLEAVVAAEHDVTDFSTALRTPQDLTAPTRLRTLALASNAWRTDTTAWQTAVAAQTARVAKVVAAVGIVDSSTINLYADRSSLPISVRNKSPYPVTVYLTVTPSNSFLRVVRNALEVTVQPDSQTRITFPVQSVANGSVRLQLSLTSATGVQIADPSTVEINVQAQWETIITAVAAAVVVLVFGLGILRNIRRRVRRRRDGLEDDDEPDPNRLLDEQPDAGGAAAAAGAAAAGTGATEGAAGATAAVRPGGTAPVPGTASAAQRPSRIVEPTATPARGLATGLLATSAADPAAADPSIATAPTASGSQAPVDAGTTAADTAGGTAATATTDGTAGDTAGGTGTAGRTAGGTGTASGTADGTADGTGTGSDRGLGRASAMLAAGTMASRVLGFVKTFVLAAAIGQSGSAAANAFAVSNQLPNSVYTLIAGGLLSAALIPQIVRATKHPDGGQKYIDKIVTIGVVVFLVVTAVATAIAPLLVRLYSQSAGVGGKGFAPETTALAVAFAFWCLPQILFYALYSLLGEVLNARQVFGPFTWAPLLNNVIAITGLVVFIALFGTRAANSDPVDWTPAKIAVLAGTATLGVAAQATFLLLFWRRAGLSYRPDFRWRGVGLRSTGTAAGWLFAMILVTQAAGVVQSRVTSLGAGAGNATLQNAWLLFMLPHSIITVSIATAYFTRMSHDAERGDLVAVRRNLALSLRVVGLFTVFASVGLMVVAFPFARLYEHGFDEVRAMAEVLFAYLPGLVLFSMLFIIQRAFWALHDHRTPFLMQVVQSVLFVIGALAVAAFPASLVGVGVAAVTTLAGTAQTVIALVLVRRRLGGIEGGRVTRSHLQFVVAAVLAGAAGLVVVAFFGAFHADGFAMTDVTSAGITLVLTAAVMALVYGGVLVVLGNTEVRNAVGLVRARLGR